MNRNDGARGDARKRVDESIARLEERDDAIRADERERIAAAIESRNVEQHGAGCLCLVCESFTYAARLVRQATR